MESADRFVFKAVLELINVTYCPRKGSAFSGSSAKVTCQQVSRDSHEPRTGTAIFAAEAASTSKGPHEDLGSEVQGGVPSDGASQIAKDCTEVAVVDDTEGLGVGEGRGDYCRI